MYPYTKEEEAHKKKAGWVSDDDEKVNATYTNWSTTGEPNCSGNTVFIHFGNKEWFDMNPDAWTRNAFVYDS